MKLSSSKLFVCCAALLLATLWSTKPVCAAEAFHSGDTFVVAQAGVPLMRGSNTLATLSQGQRLNVLRTEGDWVGTSTVVNGQTVAGWVYKRQIATPEQYAQRRTTRRSYSYQPATPGNYSYPSRGYSSPSRGYSGSSRSGGFIMGLTPYGPSYWRADRKIAGY